MVREVSEEGGEKVEGPEGWIFDDDDARLVMSEEEKHSNDCFCVFSPVEEGGFGRVLVDGGGEEEVVKFRRDDEGFRGRR